MNNYEHVICFEKVGAPDNSYYTPKAKHDSLSAQKGDSWRWLTPKSVAQGIDCQNLSVVLVKPVYRPVCGEEVQLNAIRYNVGAIRIQECEKYVEFTIWVGSLPTASKWRQFAISRANGQIVIGTFTGQQTTKSTYMQALKEFYESYPYTKVLCDVDGSKMRVRIWEKESIFKLADEGFFVRLGKSNVSNSNNPAIDRIDLGVHTYAAQDSYVVTIGASIQEGNEFSLDNITYIAVAGDTPESVLSHLMEGSRYFVDVDQPVDVNTSPGSRIISNTNKLTVQAVFDSAVSTDDNYLIKVTGTPQPGNVVQVSATGKTTKTYVVQDGDSVFDIQDYFNSETGDFYIVDGGVIPQVTFLPGLQTIDNTNNPVILLSSFQSVPSYSARRWRIVIGSDVKAGNIFTFLAAQYTAVDGDSAIDIADYFGYDSVSFQIETGVSETPNAFAIKGFLYTDSNIADVTISNGPKLVRSSQYIIEAEFPCEIIDGPYQLGIADQRSEEPELIALGNHIDVRTKAEGELIEVGANGEVYGWEYFENGLTQRMRFPVFVNPPKLQSEEERVVKFMGGYSRTTTKMEYVSRLVTRKGHLPMHVTIAAFLKHPHLRIADKLYYNQGEYSETTLAEGTDLRQASAEIIELSKEKNNFSMYRSNYYQSGAYGGFCKVLCEGVQGRLQLWLRSSEIVREIEEWQLLNTASYQLIAETFEDLTLNIYQNGNHYLSALLPKGQRVRLSEYFRMETGNSWIIKANLNSACTIKPEITYTCEASTSNTIIYDCEKIAKTFFGEFSGDFSSDLNI